MDGLRAIAVLFVFLFHLDFSFARGGFVGVDIFYVISGFVIFRGMLDQPRYDFQFVRSFYARRWRRIIPALTATILVSLAVGALVLTPQEYRSLAKSALATTFFVSNIYFNDTLSYFADGVRSMPLLHTWSLGVEEQFYLVVPWLVVLFGGLKQRRGIVAVLVATTVLSFAYNLFASYFIFDPRHAFYLPMSRFWEIGCGALAAVAERRFSISRLASSVLSAGGAAGLLASGLVIDSAMPFPGFIAVLPVASAAMMILARPAVGSLHHRIMASRPAVFFGRISYSLYLLHWPVIVYVGLLLGRDMTAAEKWLVLALTTFAAYGSWRFIEERFRRPRPAADRMLVFTGLGILATMIVCGLLIASQGWPGRLNEAARRVYDRHDAPVDPETMRCEPHPDFPPVKRAGLCVLGEVKRPVDYVLWGDSHAGMYSILLGRQMKQAGYDGVVATMADCPPLLGVHSSKRKNREECTRLGQTILDQVRAGHVRTVVLAGRWANMGSPMRAPGDGQPPKILYRDQDESQIGFADALHATVAALAQAGAKVMVIGPTPEMQVEVPNAMIRARQLHTTMPEMPRRLFDLRQSEVLAAMARLGDMKDVRVFYPHEVLCDADRCRFAAGDAPLYVDDDHLSEAGVSELLPAIMSAFERHSAR